MLKLLALDLEGSFFVSKLILEHDDSIQTQLLNFYLNLLDKNLNVQL